MVSESLSLTICKMGIVLIILRGGCKVCKKTYSAFRVPRTVCGL